MPMNELRPARLVLADGTLFEGEAIGAEPAGGVAAGEVVFNTASTGYQEILTDPSYAGQIITFTSPHIGNYGVVADDDEARQPFARGIVVRDLARRRSSWRSTDDLDALLRRQGVPGIAGIDTRRLNRVLRVPGAMPGAFGTAAEPVLRAAAAAEREPIATTSLCFPSCIAGITFSMPIFAVLKIPQRTFCIVLLLVFCALLSHKFEAVRAAPARKFCRCVYSNLCPTKPAGYI